MLARERRHPTWHYTEPRALRRRLWWAFGYDPLTLRQRLAQIRAEADWWKCRALDAEAEVEQARASAETTEAALREHAARDRVARSSGGDPEATTERATEGHPS